MVVGMARSLLKAKGVLVHFWGEAIATEVYLMNRSTMKSPQHFVRHVVELSYLLAIFFIKNK